MNEEKYRQLESEILEDCQIKLRKLRLKYVEENRLYNIGDYVHNVTGIIKVEKISYSMFFNTVEIDYYGYRYKIVKGELSRTKCNKLSKLTQGNYLKLLNLDNLSY
jgi:hypothetical protein